MPRKTLKSLMPSPAKLRKHGALDILGEWVYASNLWHLNRYSASMAFFVGLFLAFIPVPGQMLLAALGAVLLRCNLPISVGLVWITNPLTVPAIFYLAYQVGALIIDVPLKEVEFVLSVQWLQEELQRVWRPLLVGCLLCGLFFGSLGYFAVNVLWRIRVARQWRKRKKRRAQTS
ncbi:MAG: hypothetical protein ACI8RN_002564 [Glaciecola sp.]|jgi:uncharacterized protein (DUF2062 family)|uniref:DUF2062 domain-containing protein n=1 Tax=Congregibacter sp. TaxID=2744308 RepID=UPI0039E4B24C